MKIVIVLACLLAIVVPFEASSSESGSSEQWLYPSYPSYPDQMPFSNFAPMYYPPYYGDKLFEDLKKAVAGIIPPARRTK